MANFERVLPGVGRQMVLLVAATLLLPLSSVVGRASMPQASQPQPSSCLGRWPRAVWGGLALRTESASAQSVLGVQSGAESSSGLMETAPFLRLRGGISKYYNHTASPNRGGIFEEPAAGVAEDEGQSVWNKGGWTWEEKDLTRYCREHMTELLPSIATPPAPIRFVNVSFVKGHAVVTYRQGKKLAGVNWDEVTVQWALDEGAPFGEKEVNGTVKLRDFYSDFAEDMEMEVTVWGKGLSATEHDALTRCILGFRNKFVELPAILVDKMMQYKSTSLQNINRSPFDPPS